MEENPYCDLPFDWLNDLKWFAYYHSQAVLSGRIGGKWHLQRYFCLQFLYNYQTGKVDFDSQRFYNFQMSFHASVEKRLVSGWRPEKPGV